MRVFLLTLFYTLSCLVFTKGQQLSQDAKISIITCSAGEELYSLFGHSALRVQDSSQGLDIVFNYGTFNFKTPNFYTKFAKGKLDYLLSIKEYEEFIQSYKYEKRSVYSQELKLSQKEKQQLFEALLHNYQPENRAYKYDFFIDNCATRIDKIIKKTLQGNWQKERILKEIEPTYRIGIAPYLRNSDWLNLGLNIILGTPTDNRQKGLFLPDILHDVYDETTYNGKMIVGNTETLYEANYTTHKTNFWLSPLFVFSVLGFLLLLGSIFSPQKMRFFDFLLFFSAGIAGCIITFLWFFAEHTATNQNWNILWALPTHLPMAFVLLFQKRKTKFTHYYFLSCFIINCILLLFMLYPLLFAIFNYFPMAFPFKLVIPILLCLIFRSLGIIRKNSSFVTQQKYYDTTYH